MKESVHRPWTRVEELADQHNRLPPEEAASFLVQLAKDGEPPSVISLLGRWLSLPPLPSPFQAGIEIEGGYVLKEKIGEGGMGSVWRAEQKLVERDVALKMIHPALVTPDLSARFVKEIKTLGQLKHPNIVHIFGAGIHRSSEFPAIPFFTMELVEGLPLDQWAASRQGERRSQLRLIEAVCEAIQSAHERQIVHRDLKPSNILVQPNGRPIILDFGIARIASVIDGENAGGFSGTPQYAAPEQHLGRDAEFRIGQSVDIYSTGVLLFQILAGRPLFEFPKRASLTEIQRIVLESEIPRLGTIVSDCPSDLEEIIARALRRNPADRFYSMASFGRAVGRVLLALDKTTPSAPPWSPSIGAKVPGTEWRLKEFIGKGSAGEVWLAFHAQLEQSRVFKFCDTEEKARTLKRELTLYRLLKESIGQNSHFIPLHDVSLDEAPWYLMMDHVEACDLESWCNSRPGGLQAMPENQRLEIVAQAAEALQAAHEAGILHRDIKPANLLIHERQEEPHVLITDFGIGQIVSNDLSGQETRSGFTRTVSDLNWSVVSGTLLYLAPEVSQGKSSTARSDIFSLGVVLWQLLIGDLRAALDPAEWSSKISDPLLREDLFKCLSASPEKRWSSAGALAFSLRALTDRRAEDRRRQEEIKARELEAYRKGIARTAGIALLIIAAIGGLAWVAWERSVEVGKQRENVSIERTRATLGELQAVAELRSGDARPRLFSEMPKLEVRAAGLEAPLREVAIRILALPSFTAIDPGIIAVTNSSSIADRGERIVTPAPDGLEVLDLATDSRSHLKGSDTESPYFSPKINVSGLAAGAVNGQGDLRLWRINDPVSSLLVPGPIHSNCFAISPLTLTRSKSIAVAIARPDSSINVLLLGRTNSPLTLVRRSLEASNQFPESTPATLLSFSVTAEGVLAAASPTSGNVLFWKIADHSDQRLEGQLAGAAWHPDEVTSLRWSPVSDDLATGCRDGNLRIWRFVFTGLAPQTAPLLRADLGEPIRDLAWSTDGNLIAVLLESGTIQVLNAKAPTQPSLSTVRFSDARHLAFVTGNRLVAWGTRGHQVWGESGESVFAERRGSAGIVHVDFQENGVLTMTGLERTEFLNPSTLAWTAGFKAASLAPGCWQGRCLYFHDKVKWNVACFEPDLTASNLLRLPKGFSSLDRTEQVIASPQGRRAAWIYRDRLSCKRDAIEEGVAAESVSSPRLIAVSDREPQSAWVTNGREIHIFDHSAGKEQNITLDDEVLWLTFDPLSNLLACRTAAGVVFVNLSTSDRVLSPLSAPTSSPTPIAISPDGSWIIVSQSDQSLSIARLPPEELRWLNNGAELAALFKKASQLTSPYPRRVVSLDWNNAGSRLAAGTADGFVQVWSMSLLRTQLRLWKLDWGDQDLALDVPFVPIRLN